MSLACGVDTDRDSIRSTGSGSSQADGAVATDSRPVVLFLGTSLTAGLGVSTEQAFPAVVQQMIDSVDLAFRVVNAGVSGEISAGGLRRIDWLLREPLSVLVLELGANDGLRGQSIDAMRRNLQEIIDRTRAAYPDASVVIAGMQAPPNMGDQYTAAFRDTFLDLARDNEATLIPFLLEGVGGIRELNQADGIHPTVEGHRMLAATVWEVLEGVLRELAVSR